MIWIVHLFHSSSSCNMTVLPSLSFPDVHMLKMLGRLSAPFDPDLVLVPRLEPGTLKLPCLEPDPLGDGRPSEMALSSFKSILCSSSLCLRICFPFLSLPADQSERMEPWRPSLLTLAKGVLVSVLDHTDERRRSRCAQESSGFVSMVQS